MKYTSALLLIIAAVSIWSYYQIPPTIEVPGGGHSTIELTADSIRKICEIAGASQEVEVLFDTIWTTKVPRLVVFGYTVATEPKTHQLKEARVWLVKAGVTSVEIRGNTVALGLPEITSVQELESEYQLLINTSDSWNVVAVNRYVLNSKSQAVQKSLDMGILERSRASVEETLAAMLPDACKVVWETK